MQKKLTLVFLCIVAFGFGQDHDRVSSIDFVQIANNNKDEAIFYYENNWKVLREMALEKKYIHSYQLLETPFTKEGPFEIILITTYANQKEREQAEERFDKLIAQRGPLRLMNQKKPGEFRKILFNKLAVHLR